MAWSLAAALTLPVFAEDPRIPLVELQIERSPKAALEAVEKFIAEQPELAQALGIHYLRGHLLLKSDRQQEALQAFAQTMSFTPQLHAYSRYRIAVEQNRLGHPEVAAGLVATLLGSNPPKALITPAARLLRLTLEAGGDCRLLRTLDLRRFATQPRRQLAVARARCTLRNDRESAVRLLHELLEENRTDEVARLAAELLVEIDPDPVAPRTAFLVGLGFYHHREFDIAVKYLARTVAHPSAADINRREAFECRYALARSHFWERRYTQAAAAFGALAETTQDPYRRSQVLYQQARCFELAGDWLRAAALFQTAHDADPRSSWAAAAMISFLRLEWLAGHETAAFAALETLNTRRRAGTAARALLFLASSELMSGRTERAERWLDTAAQLGQLGQRELAYWRGRAQEMQGQFEQAARSYLQTLEEDPFHPLARSARRRLDAEAELATAARELGLSLASSERLGELYSSWLLLDGHPRRPEIESELRKRLQADPQSNDFLQLDPQPAADWQLWKASLSQPEEKLLALGIFEEGALVLMRHFPMAKPSLAFTGSIALARAGETRRSLYIAEILAKRIPRRVPREFLPTTYQQLLFPFSYSYLILREAARQEIDPYLLAAIIREESRFDPRAFSGASARGLTQFVFPTARRVASAIDLGEISPEDLERPEISIALGAAYLRQLAQHFDDNEPQMVAAYNAGEPVAELWRRYCLSDEPAEYLTKAAFKETRAYLAKVLTSRAHYVELYAPPTVKAKEQRAGG